MQKDDRQSSSQRYLNGIVAVLMLLTVSIGVLGYKQLTSKPAALDLNNLPPEGFAYNETYGKVPGNPENGISDLKRLYQLVQVYRRRSGQMPVGAIDIAKDTPNAPEEYGFRTFQETMEFLTNPDNKYGDSTHSSKQKIVPYKIMPKRPDETLVGGPKPDGGRDVIAYTDLYVHENIRLFNGERSTINPVGDYLVLWDDGTVEKVPHNRIVYIDRGMSSGGRGYSIAFPGQAGMPAKGVITYGDYHRDHGTVVKR